MDTVKLTQKQENFCQHIFKGLSQIDAYKAAGYSQVQLVDSIYSNASQLAADAKVIHRLAELRMVVSEAALFTRAEAVIEARTNLEGSRAVGQWGAANGALKLAGEYSGLGTEPVSADTAIDAIIKLAQVMSEAQLRAQVVEADAWHEV